MKQLLPILLVVIGLCVYSNLNASPFSGWWIKRAGNKSLPNELTIKIADGKLLLRSSEDAGVRSEVLFVDGRPHQLYPRSPLVLGAENLTSFATDPEHLSDWTYVAEVEGPDLLIKRNIGLVVAPYITIPAHQSLERWSVAGSRLVITNAMGEKTIYARVPWWSRLWRSGP